MKTGLIARAKLLDRRANGPAENQPVLFVTHFHDNRRNCLRLVARVHDAAGKCEIFVARGKLPSFGLAWHVEQQIRSEEPTSELQSLMRRSYAVFCLNKKTETHNIKV